MGKFRGIMACVSALALAVGCSPKKESVETLTGGLALDSYRLANGLKLGVVEDPTSPTVAIQVWYQVGSRDEKAGQTGLAHLFEHMMFKRTKNLKEGEFDRKLEMAGAEGSNAYTVRDATVYVVEVPKESLELALSLEAERMENLIIDDESFRTEREVVQNERRQSYENNPDGQLYQALYELAFTTSSYHWPVIGYKSDLDAMKAKDARAFFADYYHPSRAILIVVGDVQSGKTASLVHKYFGKLGLGSKIAPRKPAPQEATQKVARRKVLRLDTPVQSALIGIRAPRKDDSNRPAIEVLAQILAGGKSSRLHRALVETGVSSNVAIEPPSDIGDSLLIVGTTLQQGHSVEEAERIFSHELAQLRDHPIKTEELEAARHHLEFARHMQWMTHESIAESIGQALSLFGSVSDQQKFFGRLMEVSPADLQRAAQRFLVSSNTTTLIGVPK